MRERERERKIVIVLRRLRDEVYWLVENCMYVYKDLFFSVCLCVRVECMRGACACVESRYIDEED